MRSSLLTPSLLVPLAVLLAVPALTPASGCKTTQDGAASGEINVALRRIDVVEADYDEMKLAVILAVENGTGSDVSVTAEGSIALVGEAKDQGDGGDDDSAEAQTEGSADKPVDGKRHAGRASGVAAAYNTSELPLTIVVPLPADAAVLEPLLAWNKMAVHVEGRVTAGLKEIRIGGLREVAPPHLPEVRLKEAQVASENEGQSGAGFFTLLLDNKNPFPVTVDKLSFTIEIKGKKLSPSSGSTEVTSDEIPASAVGEYQVEVLINEAAFGKELKALLRQPTIPYVIEGTVQVRGIEKQFRFSGDMKFAR